MSVRVKICGLKDRAAVEAAVEYGAAYVGFVFVPKSPRFITVSEAASLIAHISRKVATVGLFVDPSDQDIVSVLDGACFDVLQLHGSETPQRVAEVKALTGLPVIKAIGVSSSEDVVASHRYRDVADMLLFDAKPPAGGTEGGNGAVFDWEKLKDINLDKPWFLSGGLDMGNIGKATDLTGARFLDVSSGVEASRGVKSLEKIKLFLGEAARL